MSSKPSCQKVMRPDKPDMSQLKVEQYVRAPCTPMYPPCNRKIRSPEPEPAMPICPCPAPNFPPCRFRKTDDGDCKVEGAKPKKYGIT